MLQTGNAPKPFDPALSETLVGNSPGLSALTCGCLLQIREFVTASRVICVGRDLLRWQRPQMIGTACRLDAPPEAAKVLFIHTNAECNVN